MTMRVAVISDAMSPKAIFPYWHRYYGGLFGFDHLHIVTYVGAASQFLDFPLGGLIQLPSGYEDSLRRKFIGGFVSTLLASYDVVIRVDIDEFLVVDPRVASSLSEYIESMQGCYLTARGFDVIQLESEPALSIDGTVPLLQNRGFAYPNTALNKTSVVRVPTQWSLGFHWSTLYPSFGPLFLLHTKRIDIEWQLEWAATMYAGIKDNPAVANQIKDYYSPQREAILRYHRDVATRRRVSGIESWYCGEVQTKYTDSIRYKPADGLYVGEYGHGHLLCEIPAEWRTII